MSPELPPIGTPGGGADRVQPVTPVSKVGSATDKPKDPQTGPGPKRKRATLSPDGKTVELVPEQGEPVVVNVDEWAKRYRELFGEDPQPGELVNETV